MRLSPPCALPSQPETRDTEGSDAVPRGMKLVGTRLQRSLSSLRRLTIEDDTAYVEIAAVPVWRRTVWISYSVRRCDVEPLSVMMLDDSGNCA